MQEIKYTIYKLIDPISNEIRYIGLTSNSLKQRLKSHLSDSGKTHKCNWIRKLKYQGLKPIIEPVEENISSLEDCCLREIYYISYYRNIGCNLTNSSSGGYINYKVSDETRLKMSISAKNRSFKLVFSEETKNYLSEKTKERFSKEEEREKLRISNKRYEYSKTNEQKLNDILIQDCKPVYQYDIDMNLINIYPSIRNAAKINKLIHSNISKCCKHIVRMVGGFVWRFEGDLTPVHYVGGTDKFREIYQFDLNNNLLNKYENVKSASNELGILQQGIINCCSGKYKTCGGYIWKYKKDVIK